MILRLLQHSASSLLSTTMLFKCGTCTYIVDSDIHGKGPCPMCNELRPWRLVLERGDPVYGAAGGVVGKVAEVGEGVVSRPSRAMCRGAKRDASLTRCWT